MSQLEINLVQLCCLPLWSWVPGVRYSGPLGCDPRERITAPKYRTHATRKPSTVITPESVMSQIEIDYVQRSCFEVSSWVAGVRYSGPRVASHARGSWGPEYRSRTTQKPSTVTTPESPTILEEFDVRAMRAHQ